MFSVSTIGRFSDEESHELRVERRQIMNRQKVREKLLSRMEAKGITLKGMFDEMDVDGKGEVNQTRLCEHLDRLGLQALYKDGLALLAEIDTDGNGSIDFEEFSDWLTSDHSKVALEQMEKRRTAEAYALSNPEESMNKFSNTPKGGKMSTRGIGGKRTSLTFGFAHQAKEQEVAMKRRQDANRECVRKQIISRLADGSTLEKIYHKMKDRRGEVTYLTFKRYLDRNGISVMHQDGKSLMDAIDTDGDGLISLDELETFVTADHGEIKAKWEEKVQIEAELSSATSHFDWTANNSFRREMHEQQQKDKERWMSPEVKKMLQRMALNSHERSLHEPKFRRQKFEQYFAIDKALSNEPKGSFFSSSGYAQSRSQSPSGSIRPQLSSQEMLYDRWEAHQNLANSSPAPYVKLQPTFRDDDRPETSASTFGMGYSISSPTLDLTQKKRANRPPLPIWARSTTLEATDYLSLYAEESARTRSAQQLRRSRRKQQTRR